MGHCTKEMAMHMPGRRLVQGEQNGRGRGESCACVLRQAVPEFLKCLQMRPT